MKYFVIALLLLTPLAADAQRPNRARANVQKMVARSNSEGAAQRQNSGQRQNAGQRQNSGQRQSADQHRGGGRHQQPTRSARAEALARPVESVAMPAGWNTPALQPHGITHGNRWSQMHRPGWKPGRFPSWRPFGNYYATPYVGYGWGYYPTTPGTAESEAPPPPVEETTTMTTGLLRLEVTPASGLEYYVDGVYIGSSSTLGTEFELNAGARRIEVRAPGYKSLIFDVRIAVGRETVFRAVMEPLAQPQPPAAAGNRTIYIIPGCYVGNAPPSPTRLRAGCDIEKLVTR